MNKNLALTLFISLLILSALACGDSTGGKGVETAVAGAEEGQGIVVKEATKVPTKTPEATATPILGLIKIGTHLVGTDIQPGIYWGMAGEGVFDSCYWERKSDLTGEFDSILANDNAVGNYYIEVKETDFALETHCELIQLEYAPSLDIGDALPPGTYLIGRDIQPGTYQGQAGEDFSEMCYWERMRSVSGDMDSIIANDNAQGSFYVQVLESDFALFTRCPLERVSD